MAKWITIAVTGLLVVVWGSTRFPAAIDLPGHLALVEAMRHLGEEGHILNDKFEWGIFPAPNSLFYAVTLALAPLFGILAAGKIAFVASIAIWPGAIAYLAKTFDRDPGLAVLATTPLLAQRVFVFGFLDYFASLPLVLITLAMFARPLTRRRQVLLFVLPALIFLTHVQGFVFLGLGVCVLGLLQLATNADERGERFVQWTRRVLLALAPSLILVAVWLWNARTGETLVDVPSDPRTLAFRMRTIWRQSIGIMDSQWLGVAVGLSLVAVLSARLFVRRDGDAAVHVSTASKWFLAAFCLCLALFYAVMPLNVGYYFNLYNRTLALLEPLVVVALIPVGVITPRARAPVLSLGFLAVVSAVAAWHGPLQRWDQFTEGLVPTIESIPRQSRVFYIFGYSPHQSFNLRMGWHLNQYVTVLREGIASSSFAVTPGRMIQERHQGASISAAIPKDFRRMHHFGCFDHVLVLGDALRSSSRVEQVSMHGSWAAYRVVDPCIPMEAWVGRGGPKGESFFASCLADEQLVGISVGRSERKIRSVAPMCRAEGAKARPGRGAGRGGRRFARLSCREQPLTGFASSDRGGFDIAGIYCGDKLRRGRSGSKKRHRCAPGTEPVAIRGSFGKQHGRLERFEVGCR